MKHLSLLILSVFIHNFFCEAAESTKKSWGIKVSGVASKNVVSQTPFQSTNFMLARENFEIGMNHFVFGAPGISKNKDQWNLVMEYKVPINNSINLSSTIINTNINSKGKHTWGASIELSGRSFSIVTDRSLILETSYRLSYDTYQTKILAGYARGGWRREDFSPAITFDPFLFEINGYTNSNFNLAGRPFTVLNMGPRIKIHNQAKTLSGSLFVTQTWNLQENSNYQVSPHWAFLSMEAQF